MREKTDEALLDLAGRDETAFMMLFERHREVIIRVACRLTDSTAAAEDITQECFLSPLNAGGRSIEANRSLRTYLQSGSSSGESAPRRHLRAVHRACTKANC